MGIVHRLIDPRSDYKFIHWRSPARRLRPAITELPRRLFARFFDDGSLRHSVDTGGRLPRTFGRGPAWTLCRYSPRAWDTYSLFSTLINFIGCFIFSERAPALSHATISMDAPAASQRIIDDPLPSCAVRHRRILQHSNECAGGGARLDFALSNAGIATLAFGGEMLIAGVVAQLAAAAFPSASGR